MKQLHDILAKTVVLQVIGNTDIGIGALALSSKDVQAGDAFFAIKGVSVDGHQFIPQAVAQGANVIVCENLPQELSQGVVFVQVANSAQALGEMASAFYDYPSSKLNLVGVTGTNGKTTVATILFNLFAELGYKVGLLSTVENRINQKIIPATHTTPNPIALNQLLAEMVDEGCAYCFMEVSSHAVVQQRIAGLHFVGGVFTNITHDHLDFHQTFSNYIKAKQVFFDALPKSAFALYNADDKNGAIMVQNSKAHIKSYSLKSLTDFKAKILENSFSGLLLNVDNEEVWFRLIGEFNAYNLLAVYATASLLEQDKHTILTALSKSNGAEGRFDYSVSKEGVVAVVDYAHTPDALENVLKTIHAIRGGNEKIITVAGCGGDRDRLKRPEMAKVACSWSDKVILTSDNPRSENPTDILNQMQQGVLPHQQKKVLVIEDRKEAIKTACHLAEAGDIILVAGKGHEKYQEIKGVKHPFDDKEVLSEILC